MKTVPFETSKEALRQLVIDWWELIAQTKYDEAFNMFLSDDPPDCPWSGELLRQAIATYGCFSTYETDPPEGWIPASIYESSNAQAIIESIEVDLWNSYGLENVREQGGILFTGPPLKQEPYSDLTAEFRIVRAGERSLTLEFINIHVM